MKKLSQKQTKLLSKPWITKGILVSICNKQKMHVTHFKNGDIKQKTFYKKYSNKLNKITNKIKIKLRKMHYEKNIKENQESSYVMSCHRLKGIHSRPDTNRTGAEGLSFYYPRLLHCLDQMLAVMLL